MTFLIPKCHGSNLIFAVDVRDEKQDCRDYNLSKIKIKNNLSLTSYYITHVTRHCHAHIFPSTGDSSAINT